MLCKERQPLGVTSIVILTAFITNTRTEVFIILLFVNSISRIQSCKLQVIFKISCTCCKVFCSDYNKHSITQDTRQAVSRQPWSRGNRKMRNYPAGILFAFVAIDGQKFMLADISIYGYIWIRQDGSVLYSICGLAWSSCPIDWLNWLKNDFPKNIHYIHIL